MRYLSVCSGIEAATVAWHPLGWNPVAFSEIEPFPSAVLKHHYPSVPNLGDMTKHESWPIDVGSVDLLVGGTPCQSFSVAGLRKGLSDPRGGLMLTYLEIARRLRPRWVVWENVPGVLSSGRGRDFGSFLGALGELGYGWAYRVLDAQWVRTQRHPRAVPQRRRRVFVVGCLGDAAAAASVLFERESVCRDPAPRGASRQGAADNVEAGVRTVGIACNGDEVTGTLCHDDYKGHSCNQSVNDGKLILQLDIVGAIDCRISAQRAQNAAAGHLIPIAIQGNLVGRNAGGSAGVGVSTEGASYTLTKADVHAVAFRKSKRAQSVTDDESWVHAEQANTINAFDTGERDTHAIVHSLPDAPKPPEDQVCIECRNDLAVAENWHCLECLSDDPKLPTMAHGFYSTGGTRGVNMTPELSPAVKVQSPPAIAHTLRGQGFDASKDGTGRGIPLTAQAMTVRRLTPRECERLQAFPDDYTMIPWRGKSAADCPDGPRYKALGNSMAVNCMEWIGERIAAYEEVRP